LAAALGIVGALSSCGVEDGAPNISSIEFQPYDTITWAVGFGSLVTISNTTRLIVRSPTAQPMSRVRVTIVSPAVNSIPSTRVCAGHTDQLTCAAVASPGYPWITETDDFGQVDLTLVYEVAGVDAENQILVEAYSGAATAFFRLNLECVDSALGACP
jgi:hypothetical protein